MDDDDPFANSDRTVIRPTPGRRPGGQEPGVPPAPDMVPPPVPPSVPPSVIPAPQASTPYPSAAASAIQGAGINPLVDSAAALLAVAAQLRNTASHSDVAGLREHVIQQIRSFEQNARTRGVTPEAALAARYILCTFLDEMVLSTPWGSESVWSTQSLLSTFHDETWGGEKFFTILERMRQEPTRNIDILELQFICLSMGFEGKFGVLEQGRARLTEVEDELFRSIRMQRGDFERELSVHWHGVEDRRGLLVRYVPLWVVGALAGVLLLVTYAGFRFILESSSSPAYEELEAIGQVSTIEEKNDSR